jgi:hypothetical protein
MPHKVLTAISAWCTLSACWLLDAVVEKKCGLGYGMKEKEKEEREGRRGG